MSDDLVTWLRAQLDEDQWHAEEQHRSRGAHIEFHTSRGRTTRRCIDPDRLLAEVQAKRRILDLHQPEPGQHPDFCGHDKHKMPCPTIRLLAESHREEWAP